MVSITQENKPLQQISACRGDANVTRSSGLARTGGSGGATGGGNAAKEGTSTVSYEGDGEV